MNTDYVLCDKYTGEVLTLPIVRKDFNGWERTIVSIEAPKHAGSTGRVYAECEGSTRGFYPSVFDCELKLRASM